MTLVSFHQNRWVVSFLRWLYLLPQICSWRSLFGTRIRSWNWEGDVFTAPLTRQKMRCVLRAPRYRFFADPMVWAPSWTGSPWQRPKRVQRRWLNWSEICLTLLWLVLPNQSIYFKVKSELRGSLQFGASLSWKRTTQEFHERVKYEGYVGRRRLCCCLCT